jgi:[ribosomal protein S18]-alanine N-acetyltransferase
MSVPTTGGPAMIVPMTRAHIDELMPYEQELFGSEAWPASGYREELADRRHRWYVAALGADGALVGWAGIRVIATDAEVLTIGVIPSARRRGVASSLLAALLDEARRRGARQVLLEVRVDNAPARRLYLREGFTELGMRRGYYENGRVDAVMMHRAL